MAVVKEYAFEGSDDFTDEVIRETLLTSSLRSPFTVKMVCVL